MDSGVNAELPVSGVESCPVDDDNVDALLSEGFDLRDPALGR